MGLSSSKSSTKPVYSKQIEGAANTVTQNYNQNAGAVQNIANSVQGLIPGLIDKYNAGNPAVKAATGYATDVLGGKYLDAGNPYLQSMIDSTNSDVANKVNGSLGTRGRTGGDIQTSLLARELAKNETGLRYNDYGAERDRMGAAASLAPGLAAADYAGISPVLAAAQAGTELPFSATSNYAQTIGGLLGQYTNKSQSPSLWDQIQTGIGTALNVAGTFSDRRLKTDIRKLGEASDGLGHYTFRYIWGGPVHEGVMADEVARLRPWALGAPVAGFATVHYGRL